MREPDRIRLQHMLDAAHEARAFVGTATRTALDNDRKLTLALLKCIEIIGEAAARTSMETQQAYPTLPWSDIVGRRNRLIHGYFDVDLDVVWSTVQHELPPLIEALERILAD